jgi:rSAM/selenodomain-associated transferase 2
MISVIIPTLNEAGCLPRALRCLPDAANLEIIVVDGGSKDGTADVAERAGARVLRSPPGRALQMNAGAAAARGSVLLFLHADTCLPRGFFSAVEAEMQKPGVVAGAFRLRIDAPGWSHRIIEAAAHIRSCVLQMPYGDQGIFIRKETFQELDGFATLPIMEDFDFITRLRRLGRIRIVHLSATTSGRRWQALGPWRTTWINQKIVFGYCIGIPAQRLAQWYRRARRRPPQSA